jgi:hypothetical protein
MKRANAKTLRVAGKSLDEMNVPSRDDRPGACTTHA